MSNVIRATEAAAILAVTRSTLDRKLKLCPADSWGNGQRRHYFWPDRAALFRWWANAAGFRAGVALDGVL